MVDRESVGKGDPRYRRLFDIDRAGLMWEWLRRDPEYIAWYLRMSSTTLGTTSREIDAVRWGLHFRGMSGSSSA